MRSLQATLQDYDMHLLQIIANRWDVDLDTRDAASMAQLLAAAMCHPERAAAEWQRLNDNERGALQMVIASKGHKMPAAQFERLYGEIRQVGPDRRQREKLHLNPTGIAETLYYRGLIHLMFDEGKAGVQSFVFVPPDLAAVLPTHRAGYDLSKAETDDLPAFDVADSELLLEHLVLAEPPRYIRRADTSFVDDLTTLLSYITIHEVRLDQGTISGATQQAIMNHFLGPQEPARLEMMLFLSADLKLIDASSGLLQPIRANVRHWLENTRTRQVKSLVAAWYDSTLYNELWHVPTLLPEETGWHNNPVLLRQTLHGMIEFVHSDDWISLVGLVAEIKENEPDFQRPGGDYTGWYIRDRATGDYLQGFESWGQVEGATLHFALTGPMHWSGLVDIGGSDEAHLDAFKLTAFGKAWVGRMSWPERKEPETQTTVEASGRISIARAASRYDRFQLARFTDWGTPGDVYTYTLNAASLKRAAAQNIRASHIQAFLQRTAGQALPPAIQSLLESWDASGGTPAVLERLLVLQVDSTEMMQTLWKLPEIRRFLAQQLGPRAVAVRTDQWQGLVAALEERGIAVETDIE